MTTFLLLLAIAMVFYLIWRWRHMFDALLLAWILAKIDGFDVPLFFTNHHDEIKAAISAKLAGGDVETALNALIEEALGEL
jgi:hypothetical protein